MRLRRLVAPVIPVSLATIAWSLVSQAQPAPAPASSPPPSAEPAAPPVAEAAPAPPAAALAPPPAPAAPAQTSFLSLGGDWKFGFHGIVGSSLYVQDTPAFVFNGQGPLLPLSKPSYGFTAGADVRQSRFNFSLSGPTIFGGATPKAVLEIDFFGLNSPGGFGEVSAYPRLRLAYSELNWGDDVLRFGQDYNLIIPMIPESMGHMAYPVSYFNGMIGWREPGIGYFHTIRMDESKLELAVQINKSDWANPYDFGTLTTNDLNVDYGQLSGLFGAEARIKWTHDNVMAFVSGHYNRVEGTHAGQLVAAPMAIPTRDVDVIAGVAGIKLSGAGFTLAATGYMGQNLAPLLGEILQFVTSTDVHEWGGWVELGYNVTKHLNLWAVGSTAQLRQSDVENAGGGRLWDATLGGMIRYQEGGFAVGPEFYHVILKKIDAMGNGVDQGPGAPGGQMDVNQAMLSGMYFF